MSNKKPKFGLFITARVDSSRLPNKMLLPIRSKPVIEHDIDRAKLAKKIDLIVLCTSDRSEDNVLAEIAKKEKIEIYRGSLQDKLVRWFGAVEKFKLDYFINFDGDDLFCDPELIDLAVEQIISHPCDYIKSPEDLVCGSFTKGISRPALKRACEIKGGYSGDQMSKYFTETGMFDVRDLFVEDLIYYNKNIRMTLDYLEDLTFFKTIFNELGTDQNLTSTKEIIELIEKNPELADINFFRQKDFLGNQKIKTDSVLQKIKSEVYRKI